MPVWREFMPTCKASDTETGMRLVSAYHAKPVTVRFCAGLPSPRASAAREWMVLDAPDCSFTPPSADPAPTWGGVLGSLRSWGFTPTPPSAAASPNPDRAESSGLDHPQGMSQPQGQAAQSEGCSPSQAVRRLSGSESELIEEEERALSDRSPNLGRGRRHGRAMDASRRQDRHSSSLDSSQVCSTPPCN